ncbi:hypothetical protein HPP92_025221 [Vanilla planifolia]|uniref:F-box/LRR-repeat protein 15-like leucin rich repeat domain-containing protein n=1 Tax=Vanilla planifolia TaxID=51239 RepID=A0A835PLV4_VANPL|nr:hypothetical protein HPP92_025221 [Vanilla planifolia]
MERRRRTLTASSASVGSESRAPRDGDLEPGPDLPCCSGWPTGSRDSSNLTFLNLLPAPSFPVSRTQISLLLPRAFPACISLILTTAKKTYKQRISCCCMGCHNLRKLELVGCRSITDDLFQALSENCPLLEELNLAGCFKITDTGITQLVCGCRQIKHLDVSKCGKIGDPGISRVAKACSSLSVVKLLDCCNVGDKAILSLAESCHHLESLVIGGCRYISDDSVRTLVLSCYRSLRILRMDWCSNITDLTVSTVFSNCRRLEAFDIGSCDKITDMAFEGLANTGSESGLKVLKMTCLPRITVLAITMILDSCKALGYIDLRSCQHVTKQSCEQAGLLFPESCKINFMGSLAESDAYVDSFF